MSFNNDSSTDDDSDYHDQDPGREVVEKTIRNRLQRIADHTKDELNKVLKRVDTTLTNYEYSVQSSLIQHGMTLDEMSNVEHVADIKELENLLNDSLAKQRYKQRLMIFIVGQTEQASEKAKLLQQVGQFFNEQKQNFSAREFTYENPREGQDDIDIALKSFDVKDCYIHVKTLGTRLNELNDEIVHYLIQNAGTKQQAKGKKKLAQIAKETKEQLANLQSKLETANTEMTNRDNQIEILTKELETIKNETQTNESKFQNEVDRYEKEIESYKNQINELEENIQDYKNQIEDLTKLNQSEIEDTADTKTTNSVTTGESADQSEKTIVPNQIDAEESQTSLIERINKQIKASHGSSGSSDNREALKSIHEIDLNNISTEDLPTAFSNLQKFALVRISELMKELEIKESINNEILQNFEEYKKTCEQEQYEIIERADSAFQIQVQVQKKAEEAMDHLKVYITEQEKLKSEFIHQETQTDEQETLDTTTSSPEQTNAIEEISNDRLSSLSKITTQESESTENARQTSLKEKYISIIEEKKYELDQLKQQAEDILSRPTSIKDRISLQSLENNSLLVKQQSSLVSTDDKENQTDIESNIKQDQEQQTSVVSSRHSSPEIPTDMIEFQLPFFHLYELIYKFRYSIINLLEQNQFHSFGNCLQMIKQLSSDDQNQPKDFIENSERVLKDITKILQTCLATLQSTIKEKGIPKELEPIIETSIIDTQQSLIVEEKELMIHDLTNKYENITKVLDKVEKKHEEELNQKERFMIDQQKLIQNLQQDLFRLQKRLAKIEYEGIVEPSIMFTRLDAERNEQALQQAVSKGKVPETTYNELNEVMTDYVELPSQQLHNLVKRYIQFRKTTELEDRIQSEVLDNDTKSVLEKMELLYERRSDQISKSMSHIRQQRVDLAKKLTEKFDNLEDESSIFLIRPIYSYQGRAATQSYLKNERRRREELINRNLTTIKHPPSRQSVKTRSAMTQPIRTPLSAHSIADDDDRLFYVNKSFPSPASSRVQQHNIHRRQITVRLNDLTRLQELDFQRALMPVSHSTTRLSPAFMNNGIDPSGAALNLRTYVALSRPGAGSARMEKPNSIMTPVAREAPSALSGKSQVSNPRTPYNSSAGGTRRVVPYLPPVRRSITSSLSPVITEMQHSPFAPNFNTNEVATTD